MAPFARRIVRIAALAACALACAGSPAARAQAPTGAAEAIRTLGEAGRSLEAWPLCETADRIGTSQLDLWCGIAAVDLGRAPEGVVALERYVLRHPADARARLELARAYFDAGDDIGARQAFDAVLATDPPPAVRTSIGRYLDAIDAREAQIRPGVRGWVELGGGYDSNVNAGVQQANIALPVVGSVTVADFGVEQSAGFGWLAGKVDLHHPVAPGVALYAGLAGSGQFNAGASEFDIAQGAALLGASWQRGSHTLYGTYAHGELLVGGDRYRYSDGLAVEWRYLANELVTASLAPQYARISFTGANQARGSDFYALSASVRRVWRWLWQPVLNLSAVGGREENRHDLDYLSRDVYGATADLTLSPRPAWALNAAFTFQRSHYGGPVPLLGLDRVDDYYGGSIGALYFFSKSLTGRIEAQFTRNDSNIALYQYDRLVVGAKLRYDFP
ncbi:MAG TPA: porin family protein [Casimicrobiaceae bacterium]|nr:porin family protein [Casimicrobiaceae bacterium]